MARPDRSVFQLFIWYWLPVLLYVTAIIVVSAQPRLTPPLPFQNSDKLYHLLEYLGLGIVLVRAWRATFRVREPLYAALWAFGIGLAIGIGDEVFQSTVPGRHATHLDVLADAAGVVIAQLLYLMFTDD